LFARWRERLFEGTRLVPKLVLVAVLVSPVMYYFGRSHAYLSHVLYSSYIPSARICAGDVCRSPMVETLATLNVPLPPEPPVFERYFQATCSGAEKLFVDDPRTASSFVRTCPGN
jgi:hypothetical protein